MACYWGTCTISLLSDVELILLRAAKIVHGLTEVNMETLKRIWQPLTNVYKLNLTSLMYSAYYGLIPKPICDLFHKTEQRPYNLRRRDYLRYQSTITPWEEHLYPTEGLLCGISCPSHITF